MEAIPDTKLCASNKKIRLLVYIRISNKASTWWYFQKRLHGMRSWPRE